MTNNDRSGAPIVSEDSPSYSNLVGKVEHRSQFGALVTDFTLIKPDALHRANGGYLLLDIRKVAVRLAELTEIRKSLARPARKNTVAKKKAD